MSSCSVRNASAISCDYGCCGTETNRTCCEFTLSESVIIVICVVGALVVVAIVVALIVCLTSKQKNRVTRIGPRERRIMLGDLEPRTRRVEIPKPPPYSEAPPQYDALHISDDSRSNPRSTDPILPRHVRNNAREARRPGRQGRQQNQPRDERHLNWSEPSDAPPSYVSVIQVESIENDTHRRYSPEPGTSGMGNNGGSQMSNNYGATSSAVIDQHRSNSPHPSLASGRISTSMYNGVVQNRTFHRTTSETSRQLSSHLTVSRRQRGNNSVSPVTIREITVHSHVMQNQSTENQNKARKGGKTKANNNHTINPRSVKQNGQRQINNNSNIKSSANAVQLPGALQDDNDVLHLGDSPPPLNESAAARSAKRRSVIQKLQQRRQMTSPTPVQ